MIAQMEDLEVWRAATDVECDDRIAKIAKYDARKSVMNAEFDARISSMDVIRKLGVLL